MPPRKGWAAIYCRLSKEDEEKSFDESESIRNQRELLLRWAAEHGYRIWRVYSDEDYSGADRTRPGFNAMLSDAQQGCFEVILAKTQSRFTRDMELVEKYLHGLFPEWGVRFIAVLDHVDTQDPAGKKARQINGLINEWYLEDLSGNVRAVLDHKRRSGCYIASFALYGYQKDPQDHNRLVIDPEAAAVVRRIFALHLQGSGMGKIARLLNEAAIPPPSAYRAGQQGCDLPQPMPLWSKLQKGETIRTEDGRIYQPEMVLGPARKGLKVTYTTDTRPTDSIVRNARGSDLFICEGMYGEKGDVNNAVKYKHMTFEEAGRLAKQAGVKELWLTHYSPALNRPEQYIEDVRQIFQNAYPGKDKKSLELNFEES